MSASEKFGMVRPAKSRASSPTIWSSHESKVSGTLPHGFQLVTVATSNSNLLCLTRYKHAVPSSQDFESLRDPEQTKPQACD